MSWNTSPKTGLFYVLLTSKGGNIAFLPHPLRAMLCPCSSYQEKTTNTPTLNGGDRGGVRILLFSEVTLFKYNVSTLLSPIDSQGYCTFNQQSMHQEYITNVHQRRKRPIGAWCYFYVGKNPYADGSKTVFREAKSHLFLIRLLEVY